MKKSGEHTTIRNGKLFCLNCGGEFDMRLPVEMEMAAGMMKTFGAKHRDCKPTWKEPEANQAQSIQQRALWWMSRGETGSSSKTIWHCLMGTPGKFEVNHPYDPDDFKRCYKLLKAIPEWRGELHKLKPLSSAWANLVDNWDKLTAMYEENELTNWKNYKRVGMYEFMKTLIK